jgi:hypothetical protein
LRAVLVRDRGWGVCWVCAVGAAGSEGGGVSACSE